ncbi:hypothetical protein AN477_15810 [Alicyclobacillus ferrooxydans]|uniref:Release factor glutamine methyltransferase n=1 Tax=Alicyclobacillus ferrooxydans TaxID=471514 RepID=A0A0P9CT86_9BACL|nr:hypothetical protein AN477_15810 [Alicyclobacillus ferrooxydans]
MESSGPSQGGPVSVADALQIARGEAEWLLQSVLGWTPTKMLMSLGDPLPADAAKRFFEAVKRRSAGEPIQYIIGEAPFYGRWFHVEPGCLIPRPETELLVEAVVTYIHDVHRGNVHGLTGGAYSDHLRVADIGTGSGAIAVTVALECPGVDVYAIDLSMDALRIARGNAQVHDAPVSFVHADGINWLRDFSGQIVVSNPPYIPSQDIEELAMDVRDHEPRLALDGGPDGLDFYRGLASLGDGIFADGPAAIFLEVGAGQAPAVRDLFVHGTGGADFRSWDFKILKDLQGIERIVKGVRGDG